ncbi:MAG TPA: hypothetical protein DCE13_04365 [Cryomorphaceae bacterium]|nr:MAG: hypothetical protein ABR98_00795 [Cryomorphaceae bacterium BACL7 MAG-120910-bin2]KRO68801.1 MAG: hypothetical protein ABR88_04725 [Cryomorphaceae bacterium BACL7 MAG-120322-bin74]KRO82988.1 MAG: hypothetical protein ABR87_04215 [Cryomorphaceae bacterium BACL7 MAG-121220-bin83]NQW25358.1 hypothetical protein [Cryomorphaceae bacterium]HAB31758.1 hypothetical protein [Cryomorphaceae bacterium]
MKTRWFMILILLLSAASCYYDNAEDLYGSTPCDVSMVTWSVDIQPMIQVQCLSCHQGASPSGGKDFSSYANVKLHLGGAVSRINKPEGDPLIMPPSGPLSNCSLSKMDAWIAAGALEN